MTSQKESRITLLKEMHEYILCQVGDEYAYDHWIMIVPDQPDEEDFQDIAEDDELWVCVCDLFGRLIKQYKS